MQHEANELQPEALPRFAAALAAAPDVAAREAARAFALAQLEQSVATLSVAERDEFLAGWVARCLVQRHREREEKRALQLPVLHDIARLLRNANAFQGQFTMGEHPRAKTWHKGRCYEGRVEKHWGKSNSRLWVEVFEAKTGRFLVASLPGEPFAVDTRRLPE